MYKSIFISVSICVILIVSLLGATQQATASQPAALSVLAPGGVRTLSQELMINVVFVGYEPGGGDMNIDETAIMDVLPGRYDTSPATRRFMDWVRS